MYWILAAIFLLIALTVPRVRPIAIVGGVILGFMLCWGMVERLRGEGPDTALQRGRPSAPTSAFTAFPLAALGGEGLSIAGNGAPYELRGRIVNNSPDLRLRSFTAEIARRDCYEGALDPSGCVLLWESRQWVDLGLAPGESREFVSQFWTRGDVPRARGEIHDDIRIVAADAVSQSYPISSSTN